MCVFLPCFAFCPQYSLVSTILYQLFIILCTIQNGGSQVAVVLKTSPATAGDRTIPKLGSSPGGGHGNPLQYSCLENPTDRGAWQAKPMGLQRVRHNRKELDTDEATQQAHKHAPKMARFLTIYPQCLGKLLVCSD